MTHPDDVSKSRTTIHCKHWRRLERSINTVVRVAFVPCKAPPRVAATRPTLGMRNDYPISLKHQLCFKCFCHWRCSCGRPFVRCLCTQTPPYMFWREICSTFCSWNPMSHKEAKHFSHVKRGCNLLSRIVGFTMY